MQVPITDQARHDALVAIPNDIAAAREELALATPEQQRLRMIGWIAQARALAAAIGGPAADARVRKVAQILQRLGQTWWPGSVLALAPAIPPQRVFPGAAMKSWDAVVSEAAVRRERAPSWADDRACLPRPHDAAEMFVAACETLCELGGPLGTPASIAPEVVRAAARRVPELVRIAGELRWLRGAAPALAWGDAVGRLRGLARALEQLGAPIAAVLDPRFTPPSWAAQLGRDPRREELRGSMPRGGAAPALLADWLLRAFDVVETPELVELCRPLQSGVLALRADFAARRHRRRLVALQRGLAAVTEPAVEPSPPPAPPPLDPGEPAQVQRARARFQGRRALFISNRSFPELEERLRDELGLACRVVATADSPRRRQALLQRIRRGTYDLVLVAHGFSGHADSEQFSEACRDAGIPYYAVGKGRFTRVVSCLLQVGTAPSPL